jgi:iron complex outermembrane recepter protein
MKHKLLLNTLALLSVTMNTLAQNPARITGETRDNTGRGLNASVMLYRAKDSVLVKTEVSKSNGTYEFKPVIPGNYFITSNALGMKSASSVTLSVKEGQSLPVPALVLQPLGKNLEGVTVSSKKPMVEVKADKTIVNVEGTINAVGNDGLELLRKSPGVMVDKDDNLSLSGKNGVKVYIDGKPSPLSGTDLSNYLKSLQSAQIESIEIITNPSAKYEAAGNAGIINIRLKKNLTVGTNGSANAGYNIGIYAKYNAGFALNHRNMKYNLFGNYNYSESLNEFSIASKRTQADTVFDQTNLITNHNKGSHNFKTGLDYFINANSTVGVVINGNIAGFETKTEGPMNIIYAPTNTLNRILYATGDNNNKRNNVNFNLNYRYAVTGGKELSMDADYGFFNLRNDQFQPNEYYDATGQVKLFSNVYHTVSPTDISIYSFKTDYEQNFMKGRLGLGGKIGFVNTDNNFLRYNVYGTTEVYDNDRSNRFKYNENINAAYVNYNRTFKGLVLQAGLRAENTNSKGVSTGLKYNTGTAAYDPYDSTVQRNYVDLFPSAALTLNKNPMSQWGITYSRRIDRPAYQDLNPFEFKLNDYTYMKGNTQLRPQYTNSFGITHTYKYKLNTRLNYSHVKDIFTQLPDTTDRSKSFLIKKNLATQDIVSLNLSYPFQYKWYGFFVNLNSYYSKYKANFGGGDRIVNLDVYAVSFYMQNSFKLGKGFTAELSGFYNSPSIWQGTFKSSAIYSIDGGVQKTVMKGKGTIKAALGDVFNSLKWKGTSNFSGQQSVFSGKPESRQFKLSFNMRFGNTQVKGTGVRKSAIEEENKRTESNNGVGSGGN